MLAAAMSEVRTVEIPRTHFRAAALHLHLLGVQRALILSFFITERVLLLRLCV